MSVDEKIEEMIRALNDRRAALIEEIDKVDLEVQRLYSALEHKTRRAAGMQ